MPRPRVSGAAPLVNPPKFTPRMSRRVKTSTADCPTCKAVPGEKCVTAEGKPMTGHRARRVMALRLERESV